VPELALACVDPKSSLDVITELEETMNPSLEIISLPGYSCAYYCRRITEAGLVSNTPTVFATIPSLEEKLQDAAARIGLSRGVVALDLTQSCRIESSVAQVLERTRSQIMRDFPKIRMCIFGIEASSGVWADLRRGGVLGNWVFEHDTGISEYTQPSPNAFMVFRSYREVMTWRKDSSYC
jgi:hypothetical protein